ncbi:helix-turn-helix transcriptional regulator [uncultured Sphaerochaeta sp.]|uniref:helix-turn-helix domain-containing protein n=1 Tax=uncultured Sphaerochaeta sp. TaxID=886478 RepID=UPI0029CA6D38|nr:helix-turn-helix transcriptional regulator [uncultured Sphaerochaeta sp.]
MRDYSVMKQWLIERVEETSCREVGRVLGMNHSTIGKLCSGAISLPRLDTLLKIEEAMGNEDSDPIEEYDYVAVIADEEKETIHINTNIDEAEKSLSLMAVAIGQMAVDLNLPEAFYLGIIASSYKNVKTKRETA